jgi:hypothetical protein
MLPKSRHPEARFWPKDLAVGVAVLLRREESAVLLQQTTDPSAPLMSLVCTPTRGDLRDDKSSKQGSSDGVWLLRDHNLQLATTQLRRAVVRRSICCRGLLVRVA